METYIYMIPVSGWLHYVMKLQNKLERHDYPPCLIHSPWLNGGQWNEKELCKPPPPHSPQPLPTPGTYWHRLGNGFTGITTTLLHRVSWKHLQFPKKTAMPVSFGQNMAWGCQPWALAMMEPLWVIHMFPRSSRAQGMQPFDQALPAPC